MWRRLLPFTVWLRDYKLATFRSDLIAGTSVGLVVVPQSMAYAQLAGLPAYYGLYAALVPPLIAVLFGSSRHLVTGPAAVISLMTATALQPLAPVGGKAYIAYVLLLTLLVGVFQLLLGVLKLGTLVNFLSQPVVNGFTNAAALIIATSQLSKFFGVDVDEAPHYYETVWNVLVAARQHTDWWALTIGVFALALMWGLRRLNPKIPYVLVAVALTTVLAWAIGYGRKHVADIESLDAPAVVTTIDQYNGLLADIDSLSKIRIAINPETNKTAKTYTDRPRVCLTCHSSVNVGTVDKATSFALFHRRSDFNLIGLELEDLEKHADSVRAKLHDYRFEAVRDGSDWRFRLAGADSAAPTSDSQLWRLKVGMQPVDKSALTLIGGGAVVGTIPRGLPRPGVPPIDFNVLMRLATVAMTVALLGFMEAVSIAKAIATKTGQRLDYNQELIGQGLANIAGSFSQSYPASGSFGRSALNFQVGAVTGMSSIVSVGVVAITLLFLTPVLYHLPQSVLAAIIMLAVIGLVDIKGFVHAWLAQRQDGIVAVTTFACTMFFAPHLEWGIMIGVVLSLGLYLWRQMKPHVVTLSKHEDTTYRDAERWGLLQCKYLTVIRFPNALFFANVSHLEDTILDRIASMPDLRHVLIVGNGINELDASGEAMLSRAVKGLREAGYEFSMSGLNDRVLDVMRRTGLYDRIGENHLFRNATLAIAAIFDDAHAFAEDYDIENCPLRKAIHLRPDDRLDHERPDEFHEVGVEHD